MVQVASRKSTPTRNHRQDTEEEDDHGDEMKCTGKACKSCAAGCIADCVAVCCCPCAVINILVFAFFKVPWTVAKRILKHEKEKKKKKIRKREKAANYNLDCPMKLDGVYRVEKETSEFELSGVVEESLKKNSFTTRYEEEEIFFELYQDFYLGFGRVSFTENSSNCMTN